MVRFVCEVCGENLKNTNLPDHFRICSASQFSCTNCGEFFDKLSVQAHTQCITETETMLSDCSSNEVDVAMNIIDNNGDNDEIKEFFSKKTKKGRYDGSFSGSNSPQPSELSFGKKKKSPYWAHFNATDYEGTVQCKYCGKLIRASSKNGTSGLKNHLERCKKNPTNVDKKEKSLGFDKKTDRDDGSMECWQFDQDLCRKALTRMFIIDGLPFRLVETESFRAFCQTLCSEFVPPSRITLVNDCYALFIDELKNLKSFIQNLSSRVSLTVDTVSSVQNLCYMCLTAHFINDDWNLHKKVINFCPIADRSGILIGRTIEKCLVEWNLKNILTVTVDNASSSDVAIQYLRSKIDNWGGSVLDGNYLHMKCVAHMINLIVQDSLKDLRPSIDKIRGAVRFVRSSPDRLQKFKNCVEGKGILSLVCLDVETKWDSTYLMLESAYKFRNAFGNLEKKGGFYLKEMNEFGGPPTMDDWKKVATFLPFLKIFYEITLKLPGCYMTGNTYISQIYGIGRMISTYMDSSDEDVRKVACQMKTKYEKYWTNVDNINILLFIASVLDPRYKLDYVESVVRTNYDDESAALLLLKIKLTLRALFDYYSSISQPRNMNQSSKCATFDPFSVSTSEGLKNEQASDANEIKAFRSLKEKGAIENENKNELDKYLSEGCEEDNDKTFQILQFWKAKQRQFPVLGLMARDMLAISISRIVPEYAFSTEGRVLDSFQSSLTPRMLEALICCQSWLRESNGPVGIEENIQEESILEWEEFENEMQDLILEQPANI